MRTKILLEPLYRTIQICEEGIRCQNLPKNGRQQKLAATITQESLLHFAENRIGVSTCKFACRFQITIVRKIYKNNLKHRKRKKCLKNTQKLNFREFLVVVGFWEIFILLETKSSSLIDDILHFLTRKFRVMLFFYTRNVNKAPGKVKYKTKPNFPRESSGLY